MRNKHFYHKRKRKHFLNSIHYEAKCALNRRTVLCLYVTGFQRQVFKNDQNCKWVPLTKFQWTPRINSCNVNFVGTLILLQILQQANIRRCSGFRKFKWTPHIYADSAYNLRSPLTICGFQFYLQIPRKLKFTKHIYYYLFMDSANWFRIPHNLLRSSQSCLFLERFLLTVF